MNSDRCGPNTIRRVTDALPISTVHLSRVNQTSLEAFIVRLYREANHEGFLKAFSDAPEHFNSTMTPLQTCMKMLSLRRVSLWPR